MDSERSYIFNCLHFAFNSATETSMTNSFQFLGVHLDLENETRKCTVLSVLLFH